ncbi:ATP-binding protein [Candidatus Bipolaricaulota sp. J31]
MIHRNVTEAILAALQDSPVVFVSGARQTGKTTLTQWIADTHHPARYITLDDATVLAAAKADPTGFIAGLKGPAVLDEVQRAPELLLAIKAAVDRERQPGRFLLTGSADVLLLPRLSEFLVGRMEIITLWPFSQGELSGVVEGFVDAVFADELVPPPTQGTRPLDVIGRLTVGGYPEAVARTVWDRRRAWFNSYVTAVLHRDVRDLANIEHLEALPRLLFLLASRATSLLNYAELSRSLGLPQTTLKRYLALLKATFLVQFLPAWSANLGKRLVKSPKLLLIDTGLMTHLLGLDPQALEGRPELVGMLLENFVAMELKKQSTWSRVKPGIYHFRTGTGQEVDIVLEDAAGRVVGIEVKASATVRSQDFKGLKYLADFVGDRFLRGIVLYFGDQPVPFGPNLHALPLPALWELNARPQPNH